MSIVLQIAQLRQTITQANRDYHYSDNPTLTDREYDKLVKELEALETAHPELKEVTSPTQTVGGPSSTEFLAVEHEVPMLSLNNAFTPADIDHWVNSLKENLGSFYLYSEPKIDGLAISLIYERGHLIRALTRGDGRTGEDVTTNVMMIETVPKELNVHRTRPYTVDYIEVRGEVFMDHHRFEVNNQLRLKAGLSPFTTPRNAAAGSLRQKSPKVTRQRKLSFYAYQIVRLQGTIFPNSQSEAIELLKRLGLPTNPENTKARHIESAVAHYDSLQTRRSELGYDIDGVVFKIDSFGQQALLGHTSKAPRWALAYKFEAQEASTVLRRVYFQVSRQGRIAPVAELDSVVIGGVSISRATLNNIDEIRRLGVRVGDTVLVRRAGDVIPQILRVMIEKRPSGTKAITFPQECPGCGSPVQQRTHGVHYYCTGGFNCLVQVETYLTHFVSRSGLDIDGMGPGVIRRLLRAKLIQQPADIYRLHLQPEKFAGAVGELKAQKLLRSIEQSRWCTQPKLLTALGIPGVGEETSQVLARHFPTMDALCRASTLDICSVPQIGALTATSIKTTLIQILSGITELLDELTVTPPRQASQYQPLEGQTWALAGQFNQWSRKQLKQVLTDLGARVVSSIRTDTTAMAVGSSPGIRLTHAEHIGIPIYNEHELIARLEALNGEV